jgi:hypothetical protein
VSANVSLLLSPGFIRDIHQTLSLKQKLAMSLEEYGDWQKFGRQKFSNLTVAAGKEKWRKGAHGETGKPNTS